LAARQQLAAFAEANDIARLSWQSLGDGPEPEPLAERRPPCVAFAGIAVTPPPGAFLQPSREGEQAMAAALLEAVPQGAKRILELYAGCGSFTFALAARGRVHAVEGDSAALAALWSAARKGDLAGRITVEERDLARQPFLASELGEFDVAVFDPPRAGAREQALAFASGGPSVVVALSCNPNSFARDARVLTDGGYRLEWLQGIDQFPWSGHLELVARFSR
ncbi:MAG: RsmD family RNA methyltransferase, partial [Kiloniellales bacterium]